MSAQITIEPIATEHSGDWHDKPLKWKVFGPSNEVQKFSTKKDASKYKSLRSRSTTQTQAINDYVRN